MNYGKVAPDSYSIILPRRYAVLLAEYAEAREDTTPTAAATELLQRYLETIEVDIQNAKNARVSAKEREKAAKIEEMKREAARLEDERERNAILNRISEFPLEKLRKLAA